LNLALGGGVSLRRILKVNISGGIAHNVTHHRPDVNFWVRLDHFNLEFKIKWAVTFYLKFFFVAGAKSHILAEVDKLRE